MMKVPAKAREQSIHVVIHRADGTTEVLGTVAYWHKNPVRRWAWKIKRAFGW